MAPNLNDLTVSFRHLDRERLLEDWLWLIGSTKLPILLARIGNAFVQDTEEGTVHLLNVGSSELYYVADSAQKFKEILLDQAFVEKIFAVKTILMLEKSEVFLRPGQIYSFRCPPILGGEYVYSNLSSCSELG